MAHTQPLYAIESGGLRNKFYKSPFCPLCVFLTLAIFSILLSHSRGEMKTELNEIREQEALLIFIPVNSSQHWEQDYFDWVFEAGIEIINCEKMCQLKCQ